MCTPIQHSLALATRTQTADSVNPNPNGTKLVEAATAVAHLCIHSHLSTMQCLVDLLNGAQFRCSSHESMRTVSLQSEVTRYDPRSEILSGPAL